MKVFLVLLLSFFLLIAGLFYFSRYRSAFEADQECHYQLSKEISNSSDFGCDHDLETNQWLLFQTSEEGNAAKVLKRYKY